MQTVITIFNLFLYNQHCLLFIYIKNKHQAFVRIKKVGSELSGYTVELQWLEHLRNHENMFETGVVRANEC